MTKITILGAGNMGSALACVLSEKEDNEIILWSIETDVITSIQKNKENKKYLPNIILNENITAEKDLKKSLIKAEIVVFAVPSHIIRIMAKQTKNLIPKNAIIIDVAKGLEKDSNLTMSQILKEYFNNSIIVIGGPSIANELAEKKTTFVVFASEDNNSLDKCKKCFETDYYNISLTNDVIGTEIFGMLKNIIAIYAGYNDGIGNTINTKSGIITNSLKELKIISKILGAKKEAVYSLAGIGDLIVTCFSKDSRNRRFGEALGKGKTKETAKKEINQVIEGINAIEIVKKIIKENNLKLPIIEKIINIVK